MIKRYKPIRKKRNKPRRGEPTPAEKKSLRDQVYDECGGRCELNFMPNCWKGVIPREGFTPWDHWHLVHIKSKRVHGWDRSNLIGGCPECHLEGMHRLGLKPKEEE
jgi:hypothetical protein